MYEIHIHIYLLYTRQHSQQANGGFWTFPLRIIHSFTLLHLSQKVEEVEEEVAGQRYGPGETIYGRVWWRAGQDLPPTYTLTIQRVYVCTGADG